MRLTRKLLRPVDRFEQLELLRFPFRPLNLGVLVLMFLIYTLAATTFEVHFILGLIRGVPLLYIATVLWAQFMFLVIEYTTLGYQQIPKISGDMVFPTRDHRLLKEALLIACIVTFYLRVPVGAWQFVYLCVATFATPLATAMISNEREFLRAINPVLWARMLWQMGLSRQMLIYFSIQFAVMWAFYDFAIHYPEMPFADRAARIALLLLLSMWMIRSLGILIHDHADDLGMSVVFSERNAREAQEAWRTEEFEVHIRELHDLCQAREFQKAWDQVKTLRTGDLDQEARLWRRLQLLQDPHLACRLGLDHIERLLKEGDPGDAWQVFEWGATHWHSDYRPTSGTSVLRLAEAAGEPRQQKLILPCLEEFRSAYPNHPEQGRALLLAAWIRANALEDLTGARTLLAQVDRDYPALRKHPRYAPLHALLRKR